MMFHGHPVRIYLASGAVAGLLLAWVVPAVAVRGDEGRAAPGPTLAVMRSVTAHLGRPAVNGKPSVTLGLRN